MSYGGASYAGSPYAGSSRAAVNAYLACSYGIRNFVSSDLACSYTIRSSVSADLACSYAIREWVTADLECSYGIGQAAEVWAYTLPNGVPAGVALAAVYDILTDASGAPTLEGTLTVGQILRILLAHAAGSATGLDGSAVFKSQDGATNRIVGTISGGTRTITTVDGS